MMLGKSGRPDIKRTTSITEFTIDLSYMETPESPDPQKHGFLSNTVSPRRGKAVETAPFLRACGLCKRRLAPGRDIYMYRGDTAFCSQECRQQHMNQEEYKEKWSIPPSVGSETSSNGGVVAAT